MDEINEQRKKRLKKYCPLFVETIDPVVILPYFEKMHQSTKEKISCITKYEGTERGALELHSLIPKADSDWFDYLMKALKEKEYTELLKKLKDEDDDGDTNKKRLTGYRRTAGTNSTDESVASPHLLGSDTEPYDPSSHIHTLQDDNQPPFNSRIEVSSGPYTPASAQGQQ